MENGPLKMYFLLKMGMFHCYVSLPEGIWLFCCRIQQLGQQIIFEVAFCRYLHVPWSKVAFLGDGHPTFNRNPYNWYIKPYYWVDDHPLLYGNNGSLDPSTHLFTYRFIYEPETFTEDLVLWQHNVQIQIDFLSLQWVEKHTELKRKFSCSKIWGWNSLKSQYTVIDANPMYHLIA